jgi:pimeloyl-ACP methyl ester carboxylesterase
MQIIANGIRIEVEDSGRPGDGLPVILLIMGLGMQLTSWPPPLVRSFVDAGYRVIRFDNRDIGLSQYFDELGRPPMAWLVLKHKLGLPIKPAYTLRDMAADALGVLDELQVAKAHVVGVSMGGMIAQRLALLAPQRLQSLTSIMSSSGAPGLPGPQPKVLRTLLSRPKSNAPADVEAHLMNFFRLVNGPAFPGDDELRLAAIRYSLKRADHPVGTLRQMLAVVADQRYKELGRIKLPTLVLHGTADPLVPMACGQDTAQRIAGARFEAIDGWGHDLPATVLPLLTERVLAHVRGAAAVAA